MHAPAASQGGKTRKRNPWDLTTAAGGMVMRVLSEGEGDPWRRSRALNALLSARGRERQREKERERGERAGVRPAQTHFPPPSGGGTQEGVGRVQLGAGVLVDRTLRLRGQGRERGREGGEGGGGVGGEGGWGGGGVGVGWGVGGRGWGGGDGGRGVGVGVGVGGWWGGLGVGGSGAGGWARGMSACVLKKA